MQKVEQAVAAWTARGGYRQSLLLQPFAAADIGIPKYQLKEWLQQQGLKYSEWIAALRIDEAKRVMKVHPKWTNDNIADHCGFSDRTAFQRTFKRITNMTPLQYADCLLAGHHSEREERS